MSLSLLLGTIKRTTKIEIEIEIENKMAQTCVYVGKRLLRDGPGGGLGSIWAELGRTGLAELRG